MPIELHLQDFYFLGQSSPISPALWHNWLEQWLEQRASDISPSPAYELTLRLTDDAEIQGLNAQYRQKDEPTDVLAFACLEADLPYPTDFEPDEPLYLGDVIISVETAQKQAQEQNHSLTYELAWLMSHGFLHLLGWDHPDEASLTKMLKQQEQLLASISLHSPH